MLRLSIIVSVAFAAACFLRYPLPGADVGSTEVVSGLTPVVYVVSNDDDAKQAEAQAAFDAIQKDFQVQMDSLKQEILKLETKQEQADTLIAKNPSTKFATQHLEHARKYSGTKAAMKSVLFAVGVTNGAQKNEAMMLLLDEYSDKVRLDKMAGSFKQEVPSQDIENWYLKMIEKSAQDSVKVSVMYDYAKYVSQFGIFKKTLSVNPQVAAKLPQRQLDYINADRTEGQREAMAVNLRTIIEKYGDIKKGRTTYAALAAKELFDLEHLQVGHEAPDIIGKDLDGMEFRLSDYRGKVVLLDFWGHWCPPCRAMYSTEQEINQVMADKPFVLLGVNSDRNLDIAKGAVESEGLSWRHFWNGPRGTAGPISEQWNVEGWPTFYLIDAEGIIRYKQVVGEDIEIGIEKLMAELGHKVSLQEEASE